MFLVEKGNGVALLTKNTPNTGMRGITSHFEGENEVGHM
jgi:hypothetical protein